MTTAYCLRPASTTCSIRGFIGFEDNGELIISPVAPRPSLERMGIETKAVVNVGGFSSGQKSFLDFHRKMVLLKAAH